MHRFGKSGDHEPLEHDDGRNDHKELNNAGPDNGDIPLSLIVSAISQLQRSKQRAALFQGQLSVDRGWDILLLVYLYQGAGTPISHEILCHETGLSDGTARRYVHVMQRDGLIEPASYVLTDAGRSKVEALLSFANEPSA